MGCGCASTKMVYEYQCLPMPDPFSVYVPFESLTKPTVRSIISVATQRFSRSENNSERTLLIFLLAIQKKLEEIEKNIDVPGEQIDQHIIEHAKQVRQWLVDDQNRPLDWEKLQRQYEKVADPKDEDIVKDDEGKSPYRYKEFEMKPYFNDMKRSRTYMLKSRRDGFKPEELKVYWNAEQLENLCPKSGKPPSSYDPSDIDAVENLRKYPVENRKHSGTIEYKNLGIQKAVFEEDIPKDAQIIVLNFANEQSPGGGYLRHAWAQEEIILYNSDGYRSLLDLKYGRMGGGYAIPEFGLAYVRDICFYDPEFEEKSRKTDMLVSACYCLNGQELYENPRSEDEWRKNNFEKFRAFMSAAVANTKGDGKNTYLLLGPIGTGAFGNDVGLIGEVFREVLNTPMMQSKEPIRYAFEHIWFVSTDAWKNEEFENIIGDKRPVDNENK